MPVAAVSRKHCELLEEDDELVVRDDLVGLNRAFVRQGLARLGERPGLKALVEVAKLSSQAANRLSLHDRGLIRAGLKADVVVFNPDTVQDTATYDHPDQYATGISWVLVNGKAVVADSKPTNATPGRVLRGPGYKPGTP